MLQYTMVWLMYEGATIEIYSEDRSQLEECCRLSNRSDDCDDKRLTRILDIVNDVTTFCACCGPTLTIDLFD
jgi:hypothetical protein